jgi:hypothetical protein
MGNTLITGNDDKRFNNSSVAQTVRSIVMDRQEVLLGKPVRINIAKACASNVIRPGITKEPNFSSIALPSMDPDAQKKFEQALRKCEKDQEDSPLSDAQKKEAINKCRNNINVYPVETTFVGLQIEDQRDPYCGNQEGSSVGIAGVNMSSNRGAEGKSYSKADMFMLNYCAKSLYDRGCMLMAPKDVKVGGKIVRRIVPRLATPKENPQCYTNKGVLNYGPPECSCINSIAGPSMNTWPTNRADLDPLFPGAKNPYGLTEDDLSDAQNGGNNWTKYSLNIFRQPSNQQFPNGTDNRCTDNISSNLASGRAGAYLTYQMEKPTTVCINQINIVDSNIGNLEISDVKQSCGNQSKDVEVSGVAVSKGSKVDPVEQERENQRIQKEAEEKEKAEAAARAEKARLEAHNKLMADQLAAMQKMMADMAKQKADAEAKAAADKAAADKAAAEKAKRDADLAAANAKSAADKAEAEKKAADAKAAADKAEAEKKAADAKAAEEKAKAEKAAAEKAAADKAAAEKAKKEADLAAANAKSVVERKEAEAKSAQAKADAEKADAAKKAAEAAAAEASKKADSDKASAEKAKNEAVQSANQAQLANEKAKVEKIADQAQKAAENVAKEAQKTAEQAQQMAQSTAKEAQKAVEQAGSSMSMIVGGIIVVAIIAVVIYFLTRNKQPEGVQPMVMAPQMVAPQVMAPQVVAPQVMAPQVMAPQVVAPQMVAPVYQQ